MISLLTIPTVEPLEHHVLFQDSEVLKCYTFLCALPSCTNSVARLVIQAVFPYQSAWFYDRVFESIINLPSISHGNDEEWHIKMPDRLWYLNKLIQGREYDHKSFHRFVLDQIYELWPVENIKKPYYLESLTGNAYHSTFVDLDVGLHNYRSICSFATTGPLEDWVLLAGRLVQEQQSLGIIPGYSIVPVALQGIISHREQNYAAAREFFKRVIALSGVEGGFLYQFAREALGSEEYSK